MNTTGTGETTATTHTGERELEMAALLRTLWERKVLILLCVLSGTAIFWAAAFAYNLYSPTVYEYSRTYRLTFTGVEKEQYPNGTPFNTQDLVIPAVLNRVYNNNDIKRYMSYERFAASVTVESYAPGMDAIYQAYTDQLKKNKNMPLEEIRRLSEDLARAIKSVAKSTVKVKMVVPESLNMPQSLVEKVLDDIPRIWADVMVKEKGVTQLQVEIYSPEMIRDEIFSRNEYFITYEMLIDRVNKLTKSVNDLQKIPGAMFVKDDETGMTLDDIELSLDELRKYRIEPVFDAIMYYALAHDRTRLKLFYERRLDEIRRKKALQESLIENVRKSLRAYVESSSIVQTGYRTNKQQQQQPGVVPSSIIVPQIGESFFHQLLQLAEKGSDVAYRQKLTNKIIELGEEKEKLVSEEKRLEAQLKRIEESDQGITEEVKKRYIQEVKRALPSIVAALRDYAGGIKRIYNVLNTRLLNPSGQLYTEMGTPMEKSVGKGIFTTAWIYKLFAATMFLLLMAGVALALAVEAAASGNTVKETD